MRKSSLRFVLAAFLLVGGGPALAQGAGAVSAPVKSAPTTTIIKAPPMQTGISGSTSSNSPQVCTPCDNGNNGNSGKTGYNGVYTNAYGYPQYPGPNVPLPAPGSYYANPYDYYDNYNPNNPYGYSQNSGYYNNGYYNSGYYNQSAPSGGYAPNGGYAPSGGYAPNGSNFPGFQGYNTNGGRAK